MYNKQIAVQLFNDHVQRSGKWVDIAKELYEIQMMRKSYEQKEDELLAKLKEESENKDSFGDEYAFTSCVRTGKVNFMAIPGIASINLDIYRRPSSIAWRLRKI